MNIDSGVAQRTAGLLGHAAGKTSDPEAAVATLYRDHAVSLIRLAHLMLGSRPAAEDVVHDAFCALYRRWTLLTDQDKALGYVRTSVLNGCRKLLRRHRGGLLTEDREPGPAASAEAAALSMEERREVARALRALPARQREVLVLRYYLDLSDDQISRELGSGRPRSGRPGSGHSLRLAARSRRHDEQTSRQRQGQGRPVLARRRDP